MKQKQSRFGIVSVFLSLLTPLLSYLIYIIYISYINNSLFVTYKYMPQFPTICFSTLIISGFALGLGILGLVEKNRNKFFVYLGIVISILCIIIEISTYFALPELVRELSHIIL